MRGFTQFDGNNSMPVVMPVIKRRLHNINGFYFSLSDHIYDKDEAETIFRSVTVDCLNGYLQNVNTYKVFDHEISRDNFNSPETIIEYDMGNTRLLRRFSKRYPGTNCRFRLESDKYIFWMLLRKTENEKSLFDGSLLFVDKERDFVAMGSVYFDIDSYKREGIMMRSSFQNKYLFITSPKEKNARKITEDNSDTMKLEYSFTLAINTGLHQIIDNFYDPGRYSGEVPVHNETEMLIFKKAAEKFNIHNLICPLDEYVNGDKGEDSLHMNGMEVPDHFTIGTNIKYFPLIQVSEKEMKFVRNYANKNAYVDGVVDLRKYMVEPRYGKTLRFNLSKNDVSGEVIISYELDEFNDCITFHICQYAYNKFSYAIVAYFKGIKKFNINKSHLANAEFLFIHTQHNVHAMPSNISNIHNDIVLSIYKPKEILDLINDFINLSIAIHDRPERTKIVKCVDKKYYIKKERNEKVEEKDYIIARILKTKTEAREYVEKMSGTRAECEYSVEEWDRIGHYRTLKSGKVIWVRETTCKRHLPLSEKEIHIKL